jgi:acyl carrier protein
MPAATAQRVIEIVEDHIGDEDLITVGSRFREDLGCDSLDEIELTMAFEEEFELEIPDAEARGLKTVGAVVDYIVARTARPAA